MKGSGRVNPWLARGITGDVDDEYLELGLCKFFLGIKELP